MQEYLPIVVTLIFLLAFGWMFISLFIGGNLAGGDNQRITVEKVADTLLTPNAGTLLFNTMVVGFGAGLIATFFGTLYAWLIVRTNIPGERYLRLMAILPLTVPSFVMGLGWIATLSPRIGVINEVLGGFGLGPINIYSLWGVTVTLGFGSSSLAFLLMEPTVRSLSPSLEEASRSTGGGVIRTFFRITLPLLVPGMASSFLLVSVFALGNFEMPYLLGAAQGGIETFATEIFSVMSSYVIPRYDLGTIWSIVYTIVAMGLIVIYHYLTRGGFRFEVVSGIASRRTRLDLGPWRYIALLIPLSVVSFAFIIPFIGVLGMSFAPNSATAFEGFTFAHYLEFSQLTGLEGVIVNTLIVATAGATGVVFFSILISYTAVKADIRFGSGADYVSTAPLGLPPIVYGIAIFWFVVLLPVKGIYGTMFPLILAIVFLKIPHGVRMISSNMIQISDELEEASRISGASWLTTLAWVLLPLIKGGAANAFLFTFIDAVKELAAVILLITAGNSVFMAFLFALWANDPNSLPTVAAGSVMLSVLLAAGTYLQAKVATISY